MSTFKVFMLALKLKEHIFINYVNYRSFILGYPGATCYLRALCAFCKNI